MQEWRDFIQQLALLISSIVGGLTAFSAFQKQRHDSSNEDKEALRKDRDFYRDRWRDAEKGFEDQEEKIKHLEEENESLRDEVEKLTEEIKLIKKRGNYNAKPKRKPKAKYDDN